MLSARKYKKSVQKLIQIVSGKNPQVEHNTKIKYENNFV